MNDLQPHNAPFRLHLPSYNKVYFESIGMLVDEYPEEELAIVRYHKNDNEWKVREKGHCQRDLPMVQIHRSVIYDLTTKTPLVVAPIRRIEDPSDADGDATSDSLRLHTQFWDGTMIHVFFVERLGWMLSSRSKLYATCKFISDRLFSELFKEACEAIGLDFERDLSKDRVYSYVLLHPETRRVFPVEKPTLKLVQTHSRAVSGVIAGADDIPLEWSIEMEYGDDLKKSVVDSVESSEALSDEIPFAKMIISGWKRYRITNNLYRKFSHYRGVYPKRETCLIDLLIQEKGIHSLIVKKYMEYFVEDAEDIKRLYKEMNTLFGSLHHLYIQRHIRKTIVHENLPHWSRKLIWDLHGIHLREKKSIQPDVVVNYMYNLRASQIGKVLNDYKKQGIILLEATNPPGHLPHPHTTNPPLPQDQVSDDVSVLPQQSPPESILPVQASASSS
jgi:hypothetical protein